jgi:hypothetical protein
MLIPRGMAQRVMLGASEALRDAKVLTNDGMRDLRLWLSRVPSPEASFTDRRRNSSVAVGRYSLLS